MQWSWFLLDHLQHFIFLRHWDPDLSKDRVDPSSTAIHIIGLQDHDIQENNNQHLHGRNNDGIKGRRSAYGMFPLCISMIYMHAQLGVAIQLHLVVGIDNIDNIDSITL